LLLLGWQCHVAATTGVTCRKLTARRGVGAAGVMLLLLTPGSPAALSATLAVPYTLQMQRRCMHATLHTSLYQADSICRCLCSDNAVRTVRAECSGQACVEKLKMAIEKENQGALLISHKSSDTRA
jgi:hypothetical protein